MAAVVAVGAGALVAWLAFGVFGVHTLFFDDKVEEAVPVFESGAAQRGERGATTTTPSPASSWPNEAAPTTAPAVTQVAAGTFMTRSHPASGSAVVLSDGTQTFLRFEDFKTDNGPDLFVYLSRGTTSEGPEESFDDDFVNLGALKGNIGEQNYEVPPGVDINDYSTVVVWCRKFSVAFGAADLA